MNPAGQFFNVLFEHLTVNHAEEQTRLLVINGVVINISPIDETAYSFTIKDGLVVAIWSGNDNKNGLVNSGYHVAEIFCASSRICLKKRVVASSFERLASSAASFINCESTASEGSSILVNRYVSIVGFIIMMLNHFGCKYTNNF